jgi:hypothetical protein
MLRLVDTPAPSEVSASEHESRSGETMCGDTGSLHTATGIVIGGLISGLFWGVVGVTAWLVI